MNTRDQRSREGSRILRRRLALAAPLLALAAYLLMLAFVPGFAGRTRAVLRDLGLMDAAFEPFVRPPMRADDRVVLWAGEDDRDHFDITNCLLAEDGWRFGLGREHFPALIEPVFITVAEANAIAARRPGMLGSFTGGAERMPDEAAARANRDDERVLLVEIDGAARVYPISTLRRHEVVNDVVGGTPVFAAYCYLADLGAVYDRRQGDHHLTFALSGYTYRDRRIWDGRDAFVLWDRETESLWWPPAGRAVAGPLVDRPLPLLDASLWSQTTWGVVRERYPHARVLAPAQRFERPGRWPRLEPMEIAAIRAAPTPNTAIAPAWGEQGE